MVIFIKFISNKKNDKRFSVESYVSIKECYVILTKLAEDFTRVIYICFRCSYDDLVIKICICIPSAVFI